MAFLTVRIKGTEGYTRSALGKDRMVLGRASATDLPIKHTSISREHCAFVREGSGADEKWLVEDLGSSNGTWVGKVKVNGRQALAEKDIVKVGHARLTFHAGEMSQAEAIEVAIDDDAGPASADGVPTESRARGQGDPPEAIACATCGGWFSIAHRLSGESMPCPRCGQAAKIPVLT
jgi:pSer/pThr/pTyr-binding forkhead associated (FHA) protein